MTAIKTFRYIGAIIIIVSLVRCEKNVPMVCIRKQSGDTICVTVEVASTPIQRNMGLMYRKSLAQTKGMLFIFETDKSRSFTMKNTFIPLDMIFIDRTKKIVGWIENTQPLTKGPYKIDVPSRYVLEVNAFFCKQQAIAVGDMVEFKNIDF